ncbi:MAG: hypothetical protein ABIO16_02755 [Nocardioides sp.]
MDDVTWGALTFSLTALGGFYTWWAYKNRGATPAMRGLAITLLPAAAWLTGTLQMFTRIANAISDWALHLAFSPKVWFGVILAATSVGLFFLTSFLSAREIGGGTPRRTDEKAKGRAPKPKALPRAQQQPGPLADPGDDGIDDEIAAILKRRGIS